MKTEMKFYFKGIREKGVDIHPHRHNCCEIVYYLRGSGSSIINEKKYAYAENTYAIIEPNLEHFETHTTETVVLFIGFDCAIRLKSGVFAASHGRNFVLPILEEVFHEASRQEKGYETLIVSKLNELAVKISRSGSDADFICKDLSFMQHYIEENCSLKINLRSLSALCGYSYDYFRHMFKEKTGFSPRDYVIEQRLQKAKEQLEQKDISMTEVSYACGFSNNAQFSMLFKRRYGQTPKSYASIMRK